MTPRNPDSFIDLSTLDLDFGRPKAVVHLGNAKASPQDFPGGAQTQNDRATWDAMDAVSDKIALIFAGNEPFDILAGANRTIPVPAGTRAQRLATLAAFKARRDDLGTTHHDAGTLRMGDNVADAVTNDFGRIHDTANCYVTSPALFPTVGSPNPMLTGVALARRTGDLLNKSVLPGPDPVISPQPEAGFRPLFDGTAATFKNWRLAGPGGGGMLHVNGEMVSYGDGGSAFSSTPRSCSAISICGCNSASSTLQTTTAVSSCASRVRPSTSAMRSGYALRTSHPSTREIQPGSL